MTQFQHIQSAHCENGVTTSLLKHQGVDFINEPLAFGIGSGLFYIHIPFMKFSNGPAISFRTMPGAVFNRTCKALKIKVEKTKFKNPKDAEDFLNAKINANIPVGCQVGVFHLTYFPKEYRFHFNAHNLIVYGKENGNYLISDPIMETTTTLTPKELEKVRFAQGVLAPKGHIYYPKEVGNISEEVLKRAIVKGIKRNVRDMIKAPGGIVGTNGIKYTARRVKKWRDKVGEKRAGLYLGHIVRMQEEIGTGGGGFRFIYAAFLEQASNILGIEELKSISDDFTNAGDMWRANAVNMASVYKGRTTNQEAFNTISELMMDTAEVERAAFKKLGKIIKDIRL